MMNDARDPRPYTAETGSSVKIAAALVVALGFGTFGAIAYESGGWNSQALQKVSGQPASAQQATAENAPGAAQTPDVLPTAAPETAAPPAEPVKAADTTPQVAPVADAPAKQVKVARVQRKSAPPSDPPAPVAAAATSANSGNSQPVVHDTAAPQETAPAPESPRTPENPAAAESAPAETPATPQ